MEYVTKSPKPMELTNIPLEESRNYTKTSIGDHHQFIDEPLNNLDFEKTDITKIVNGLEAKLSSTYVKR